MPISRITLRKLKSVLFFWCLWLWAALLYAYFRFYPEFQMPLPYSPLDLILFYGSTLGVFGGIYEAFIIQDNRSNRHVIPSTLVRLGYYTVIHLLVVAVLVITAVPTLNEYSAAKLNSVLAHPEFFPFLLYTLSASVINTFIIYADRKFGHRSLFNTLLGRYQSPVTEDRIFMFVDLKGATALAEELGPRRYSAFLRDYFFLVSNVCAENKGEIYQYAGDGVWMTWKLDQCRNEPLVLQCFYDLRVCFRGAESRFLHKYGKTPTFKAAAHTGRVIAAEVGNFGCEKAYHGDVLNSTSRIQSLCNILKRDFLISEYLLFKLPRKPDYKFTNMGDFTFRGKNRDLDVFAVELREFDDTEAEIDKSIDIR